MRRLKNILLIFIFCWFYRTTNAQYSIAVNTVGIYANVIPNTLMLRSYYVDINQDGNNHIRISSPLTSTIEVSGYHAETMYTRATSLNNKLVGICSWETFRVGYLLLPINVGQIMSNDNKLDKNLSHEN